MDAPAEAIANGSPARTKRKRPKTALLREIVARDTGELAPDVRLTRDIRDSATTLTEKDARYSVDLYYQVQQFRIQSESQLRTAAEGGEPHAVLAWIYLTLGDLESGIQRALDRYTDTVPAAQWAKSVTGIGPVIAAGLCAYIDIRRVTHASGIWRFFGLDPSIEWLGKERAREAVVAVVGTRERVTSAELVAIAQATNRQADRLYRQAEGIADPTTGDQVVKAAKLIKTLARPPYSLGAKVLAWKIGSSFEKTQNLAHDFYGRRYAQRKLFEQQRNATGYNRPYAERQLASGKRFDKAKPAYLAYAQGKISDGQVRARAMRWATKLFLAHYFEVAYEAHHHAPPPHPYAIARQGHADRIDPPGAPARRPA